MAIGRGSLIGNSSLRPPLLIPQLCTFTPVCYIFSMTNLTPIQSEFSTTEEAEAYGAWCRAKVEAALADPRPGIPHDQVMAKLRAIIEKRQHP